MKRIAYVTVAVLVLGAVAASPASAAPYVDNANTHVLLHMDTRSAGGPFTTPDDDSANPGRDHEFLIRNEHFDTAATDAKFVAGQAGYGSAIQLDGVDDRLQAFTGTTNDDLGVPLDNVRIDISAKLEMAKGDDNSLHYLYNQPEAFGILFTDRSQGDWRMDFRIWTDAGLKQVAITDVSVGVDVTQWHEYSMTYSSGTVEGFIDGVSVGTTVGGTQISGAIRDLSVGAEWNGQKYWGGTIDEFRITTIAPLSADFDGDGNVDGDDLNDPTLGWQARFGADLDGSDFLSWQREFGSVGPATSALGTVPEPSTLTMVFACLIGFVHSSRRRFDFHRKN